MRTSALVNSLISLQWTGDSALAYETGNTQLNANLGEIGAFEAIGVSSAGSLLIIRCSVDFGALSGPVRAFREQPVARA